MRHDASIEFRGGFQVRDDDIAASAAGANADIDQATKATNALRRPGQGHAGLYNSMCQPTTNPGARFGQATRVMGWR